MCRPTYFELAYAINAWMDPSTEVDRHRALGQWRRLRDTYRALGHEVLEIEPAQGLPDMWAAANAGLVLDGKVLVSRFKHPERQGEQPVWEAWFRSNGLKVFEPRYVCEGEGDLIVTESWILAGTGFRAERDAQVQVEEVFGRPTQTLSLVDPRFYHLDTALFVLSGDEIAFFPQAFSPESRAVLDRLFPDAIHASEKDAMSFGLNAVSDGHHVVLPVQAEGIAEQVSERGYEPIPVDVSEFFKAGGSIKCATLELRV